MAYRIRVAKTAKTIYDSAADQVFDSDYSNLVIVDEGIGSGSSTITNPLGIATVFFCWHQQGFMPSSYNLNHNAYSNKSDGSLITNTVSNYKYMLTQQKLDPSSFTLATPTKTGTDMIVTDGTSLATATWEDIRFFSAKRTLQIWKRDYTDVYHYTDNNWVTVAVPHGLGFTPAFIAFATSYSFAWRDRFIICDGQFSSNSGIYIFDHEVQACADNTNIYFRVKTYGYDIEINPHPELYIFMRFKYIVIGAVN